MPEVPLKVHVGLPLLGLGGTYFERLEISRRTESFESQIS
jgi:hypothetical protein